MNYKNEKGFTLTELMTVVIIVAILMGIAVGAYLKASERAIFNEGLTAAYTVAEAMDRYHADHPDVIRPKMADLSIALSNAKTGTTSTNYCIKTKFFEICNAQSTNAKYAYVRAVRNGEKYTLFVYPETYGSKRFAQPYCKGKNGNTKFCISMGFTNCDSSDKCRKPLD